MTSHSEMAVEEAQRDSDGDTSSGIDPETRNEEIEALARILHAILEYRDDAAWEVKRWEHNYKLLSDEHRRLLPDQAAKHKAARRCIDMNDMFFRQMVRAFVGTDGLGDRRLVSEAMRVVQQWQAARARVSPVDTDKCRYVLKNMVRDWGEEGAEEREQSYGRILAELQDRFPPQEREAEGTSPPRVLVPGAGLGRLCLDAARLGFHAEGNEFSYYMLMASSFVMNHCERAGQWALFPYVLNTCNQRSDADQLRQVSVPDVLLPEGVPAPGSLSMCGGDFVEVYGAPAQRGAFDCVATCFFLDTAHNVITYMETIWHVLREGGLWINLGPLLYHWADAHTYLPGEERSIEISLEDVQRIAQRLGFELLRCQSVAAGFNTNARSMHIPVYNCAFWTMRKGAQL